MHVSAGLNLGRRDFLDFHLQIVPIANRGKIGEPSQRQSPVNLKGHMVVKPWIEVDQKLPISAFNELSIKDTTVAGVLKQLL
jgi:hypothetical protein